MGANQKQEIVNAAPLTRPIQVIEIGSKNNTSQKSFSGTVHAEKHAALSFRVAGTVNTVRVSKGDLVQQGQVIATLDPHDYQVTLEELQARMLEAQSAHKLAKAELARVKQATADDALASVTLDRAISGYERSLSAVKVVEKNIQRAEDALSYTTLHAPFSGRIGEITIDAHEQVLPALSIASIQQDGLWQVDIDVPENLIRQFTIGQSAQLSWFGAKQSHSAIVTEIAPKKNPLKQTYSVTLNLQADSSEWFNGKAVTVTTNFTTENDSYCLPYSAVIGENANLKVNVVRDFIIQTEPVSVSSIDAYQTCVTGNILPNDYVVVSGSNYLQSGDNAPNLIIKTL